MAEAGVTVDHVALEEFARRLLIAAGIADHHAGIVAENLIFGNLRGVDSHGMQLLPSYIEQLRSGNLDGAEDGHVLNESGATLLYDAANGLGAVTAELCCAHARRLAAAHGISIVVARNATHFGAAAFWGRRLAAAGYIGLAFCNASPIVPPWQAKEPRLGTNPICMAVPGPPDTSWLLDMATTTVAANRIFKAFYNQEPAVPAGWAMDREGRPTTDTVEAFHGLVMPLGGHKGSGLAVMVEILCAILGGGAMSTELGGLRIKDRPMGVSHTFLAIDPRRFAAEGVFEERMDKLEAHLHSAAPAAGYSEVLIAGDPETRMEARRRVEGVPLGPGEWRRLLEWAEALGVSPPAVKTQDSVL